MKRVIFFHFSGVGKTSLISTLCTGHFSSDDDYKP